MFLLKSQDFELVTNYLKLIENLIKVSLKLFYVKNIFSNLKNENFRFYLKKGQWKQLEVYKPIMQHTNSSIPSNSQMEEHHSIYESRSLHCLFESPS